MSEALAVRVELVPKKLQFLTIECNESYVEALEFGKGLNRLEKEIDSFFDPIIKKAHETHKESVTQKKRLTLPITESRVKLNALISDYLKLQEERRKEEEVRLQAIEKKKAQEQVLAQAVEAEVNGHEVLANDLVAQAVEVPVVVVKSDTPKVVGVSSRTNWKFRITNPDEIPREYLSIDEKKIGQVVRALKGQTKIPGVEAYEDKITVFSDK